MMSLQVLDMEPEAICEEEYDVAFFCSGYEARCTYMPNKLSPDRVVETFVLGFTEKARSKNRPKNDKFYQERWGCKPLLLSGDNEKPIYDCLHRSIQSSSKPIRILIDYSSMSRLWYAAVLNWARFHSITKEVTIDFVYSMGSYEEEQNPMVIREMVSIPGCEGRAYRLRKSVAVFGLGFHGLASLCVLDRLEADIVYAFLASPGSSEDYVAKTREINTELIANHKTQAVFEMSMSSIESTYRALAETISPHRPDGEITLVPMGPKPHVLASILVAMRFPEVACLRVSGNLESLDVLPTGEVAATRVILNNNNY